MSPTWLQIAGDVTFEVKVDLGGSLLPSSCLGRYAFPPMFITKKKKLAPFYSTLRKQPTFGDATTGFPAK